LVFAGTRVFVSLLWQFLAGGSTLDEFIAAYPTVDKEQAAQVIELAGEFFHGGALKADASHRPEDTERQGAIDAQFDRIGHKYEKALGDLGK